MRGARTEAEAITSRIMARYVGELDEADLADFAELIETTRNAIDYVIHHIRFWP